MPKTLRIRNSTAEFLIFTKQAGDDGVEVRVQDGTIWLSQKLMASLFDCSVDNISLHIKNIFADKELDEISTTEDFSTVDSNGKTYQIKHYNLDAIISVGYRINTKRATVFRQWAASVLRGYLIDKKRMKRIIKQKQQGKEWAEYGKKGYTLRSQFNTMCLAQIILSMNKYIRRDALYYA
jgi:hypothetical protein